jgi:predicted transcriptional regulator YdeE
MPLVAIAPTRIELPDLRLVGACSFANYFENGQQVLFGETWERLRQDTIDDSLRTNLNEWFGLELYPADFKQNRRWYYAACAAVKSLDVEYPSHLISRFIPAAEYVKFTVKGPVTEIAPAFRHIYDSWLPQAGVKLKGYYDLEYYDERFKGPCDAESMMDILLPLA